MRDRPLSIVTATTLFPNRARPSHGIFVKTRLKKLLATAEVEAQVVAPLGWMPPLVPYPGAAHLRAVSSRETIDGINVDHPRYLIIPKIGMSLTPHFLYRAMTRAVTAILASGRRIDLIDAHYFYPDGVAASWVARDLGLPLVITARGTDLNLIPQFAAPRRMIKAAAEAADGIITVAAALKEPLVELGIPPERVTVLRNGVDLDFFHPMPRGRRAQPIRHDAADPGIGGPPDRAQGSSPCDRRPAPVARSRSYHRRRRRGDAQSESAGRQAGRR